MFLREFIVKLLMVKYTHLLKSRKDVTNNVLCRIPLHGNQLIRMDRSEILIHALHVTLVNVMNVNKVHSEMH